MFLHPPPLLLCLLTSGLSTRPENAQVQQLLHEEVKALAEKNVAAIRNNPYVNAVLKETMRIHPTIISTLPRLLLEPLKLGDHILPPGTIVGMQNYIHHRDPVVFPEPDRFYPNRWLESTEAMASALTPFGTGKRNCIGQNLAWQELYWAVDAMVRANVFFKLGPEMEDWEMHKVDRFNIAPRGRRLMLVVVRE